MKLTTVILLFAIMQVSANSFAQRISLSEKNAPIDQVFKQIRQQTGFDFMVTETVLKSAKPVNINVKDAELKEVLDQIFKEQPLDYQITDKAVLVKLKEKSILNKIIDKIKTIDITGRVLNEQGAPIQGATVKVQGSLIATITDEKGVFTLKGISEGAIIIISVIGYEPKTIAASTNIGSINMTVATSKLDEVKIQAYGVTSQRFTTGNISSVKATDIEKQPVNNPLLALEGRVPGLQITQASGNPGSGVTVRIQGQNSIAKGNDPFYVIDGVPYPSLLMNNIAPSYLGNSGGTYLEGNGSGRGNPLSYINPADIESIDVLKDADATAIYGSKAANGAILITTKKGKAGQTRVDVTMQQGVGKYVSRVNMLNTEQYLQIRAEAKRNSGAAILPTDYDINGTYDKNRYTDWQKVLLGGNAIYSDMQSAISGGSLNTNFRINGGYHRETSVFPGDLSDVKASIGFNINHTSTNQKFKIQLSGNYLVDNNKLLTTDLVVQATSLAPNAPALYNGDGTLNRQRIPPTTAGADSISTFLNPLANFYNTYSGKTSNLVSNGQASYQILRGLILSTTFGFNNIQNDEIRKSPLAYWAPELRSQRTRGTNFGNGSTQSWIIEPQVNYSKDFGQSHLSILVGSSFQESSGKETQLSATGFISDQSMEDIRSASTVSVSNNINYVYKYNAIFGRVNYIWNDKYLVNGTFRRDGSSRFGPENQFHNFGAVGAAWIFSNEPVIKEQLPFLSFGKLRSSYGTTGNDQINNYTYLNQYSTVSGVANNYQSTVGLIPTGLSNPYLQWEETRKWQTGIDLGFFKDRLLINANYFDNRSSNQLLSYALPYITGFSNIPLNFPATVQNSGWELSLNTINLKSKSFVWSTGFNFTIPKNKLLSFSNLENSSYNSFLIIGQSINISKDYMLAGVNAQTGTYQFITSDGTVTSGLPNGSKDQIYLWTPDPKFYGGLQNNITYKNLSLDFLLQFTKQVGRNIFTRYGQPGGYSNGALGNLPDYYLQRWQQTGDNASIQKFTTSTLSSTTMANGSNLAIADASFIRLKNVSLSWSLPTSWINKVKMQNFRLFLQGQNLLTFTRYKGLDPETLDNTTLPPLRVITFGIQATL